MLTIRNTVSVCRNSGSQDEHISSLETSLNTWDPDKGTKICKMEDISYFGHWKVNFQFAQCRMPGVRVWKGGWWKEVAPKGHQVPTECGIWGPLGGLQWTHLSLQLRSFIFLSPCDCRHYSQALPACGFHWIATVNVPVNVSESPNISIFCGIKVQAHKSLPVLHSSISTLIFCGAVPVPSLTLACGLFFYLQVICICTCLNEVIQAAMSAMS